MESYSFSIVLTQNILSDQSINTQFTWQHQRERHYIRSSRYQWFLEEEKYQSFGKAQNLHQGQQIQTWDQSLMIQERDEQPNNATKELIYWYKVEYAL